MQHFDMTLPTAEPRRRAKRRRGHDTIGRHRLPHCPTSGKVRYRDHAQASDGLRSAKEARLRQQSAGVESRRRETRSYKCPDCRGWHNTSRSRWVEVPVVAPPAATDGPLHVAA